MVLNFLAKEQEMNATQKIEVPRSFPDTNDIDQITTNIWLLINDTVDDVDNSLIGMSYQIWVTPEGGVFLETQGLVYQNYLCIWTCEMTISDWMSAIINSDEECDDDYLEVAAREAYAEEQHLAANNSGYDNAESFIQDKITKWMSGERCDEMSS